MWSAAQIPRGPLGARRSISGGDAVLWPASPEAGPGWQAERDLRLRLPNFQDGDWSIPETTVQRLNLCRIPGLNLGWKTEEWVGVKVSAARRWRPELAWVLL